MTEEASDPAVEATAEQPSGAPARPRRRRRGGRGRGRSATSKAAEKDRAGSEPVPEGPSEATPAPRRPRRRTRPAAKTTAAKEPATKPEQAAPAAERQRARPSRPRTRKPKEAQPEAGPEAEAPEVQEAAPEGEAPKKRRRRRRRRRPGATQATAEVAQTRPARAERSPSAQPAEEAPRPEPKKPAPTRTRVRRKTPARRRREPVIHPRRATDKVMLITRHGDREQMAVVEGRELVEHYVTRVGAASMVGNIYLGRVQNVLPGMEAAFVDVGRGRNAVLYAGEVSYDEEVEAEGRRIEAVLKPGQSVLVQVTKDPLGGKGPRLTTEISLAGRFLVYVPSGGVSGLSRRLPDKERLRLRDVLKRIRPSEAGVIVRTAAEGAGEDELAADLDRLKKTWDSIKRKSRRAKAPAQLYEEPELIIRVIRDVFSPAEFREIATDDREFYEKVTAYLNDLAPSLLERVRLHDGPLPVLEEFHVAEQIHKALERKVWLPSGGYVIIDRTEAMTVIDVNTGKHVGKTNLEETVFGTNVEAAKEIARQLRLRDIGGIIVIDFIDMLLQRNREQVIQTLKEELARDKTRSQVFDITPLGLLEITRKKVSAGLLESFSETCPTCEGRGILLTHDL